jgi:hypothetical protein
VVLYESLLETNESTAETSYHLTGSIDLEGYTAVAAESVGLGRRRGSRADGVGAGCGRQQFARLYANGSRRGGARDRSGCGGDSAARGCGTGGGAAGLRQHGSCRRHGGGGGDAAAMARGGAQCADYGEAAGAAGSGQSAAAGLGCRYAGQDAGPAAPAEPRARWRRRWPRRAASTRRTAST